MKNATRVVDSNFDRYQARQGLSAKNQSQLTKLIPLLQVGSKAGPDDAQIGTKLERRVSALTDLRFELRKSAASLAALPVVAKELKLKKLTIARRKLELLFKAPVPHGLGKVLKSYMNELTTLREGVFIGDIEESMLEVTELPKALVEIDKQLVKAKASLAKHQRLLLGEDADPLFSVDAASIIERLSKDSKNLESLKDKDFVISRIPVIPIALKSMHYETLKANGFNVDSIGGYPVVHGQLVIGINPKSVKLSKRHADGQEVPRDKWLQVAFAVKKLIELQLKTKLSFVEEKPCGMAGGAWFWVMPSSEVTLFAKAFPGSHILLKSWGPAF